MNSLTPFPIPTRFIPRAMLLLWLLPLTAAAGPAPGKPDLARLRQVDAVIDGAIDQAIYRKASGHRALKPKPIEMTPDTIFDLASLSKPIGCSTSIMILA